MPGPEWRGQSVDIGGLVLKTYGIVAPGVLLQDERRKNRRGGDLAKAPVSQKQSVFTEVSLEIS